MASEAEEPVGSTRELIVSLRTLRQVESVQGEARPTADVDPIEQALVMRRYQAAVERLEEETEASDPDVLVTIPDRDASLLQSKMAAEARAGKALGPGGQEVKFGTGIGGGDWFGWLRSLFDWVDRKQAHDFIRPTSITPETLPNRARIAVVGDWGTGLYGAPVSATSIGRTGPYDLLLHLGDVYYSGTSDEVKDRYLSLWPFAAGTVSRSLNANHEMYSGGYAYFDDILPRFQQASSCFATQNDHWLLIGLDTAYVDHDMDAVQAGWVNQVIKNAGKRKIVFLSHQQLFSRLSSQGPKLLKALRPVLESKLVSAWYWGHEHQCVLYDPHPTYGLIARCIGHGGIPELRDDKVKAAPVERQAHDMSWKRLSATADSPSCLALDGENRFIKGKEGKFGPHGYVTLELDGPVIHERVFTPDGLEIWSGQIGP